MMSTLIRHLLLRLRRNQNRVHAHRLPNPLRHDLHLVKVLAHPLDHLEPARPLEGLEVIQGRFLVDLRIL